MVEHIRAEIVRAGGFITFARYMELALYAPALGYYVAGARKFGSDGDFVTAPELTPLYGAALARQVEPILATTADREVVELGAGSGALATSLLVGLASRGASPARYRILEISPELKSRQAAALATAGVAERTRIEWIDRLPAAIDGVVVMNEVLDAVAPRLVARRDGAWLEHGVAWTGTAFAFEDRALADARVLDAARSRFPVEGDYVSEINLAAEALVGTVGRRLTNGGMLIVDYGFPQREYFHPQRGAGTIVGHYRHRVHADPFLWPGLSDLTTHVDFTAIADAATRAGLRVTGFTTQASLLVGCGLLDLLQAVGPPEGLPYLRAASAAQTLLSPAEMGELFKVLLLGAGEAQWPVLAVTDMTHRL